MSVEPINIDPTVKDAETEFLKIDLRDSLVNVKMPEIIILESVSSVPGLPVGVQKPVPVGGEPKLFNFSPVPAVPGLPVIDLQI